MNAIKNITSEILGNPAYLAVTVMVLSALGKFIVVRAYRACFGEKDPVPLSDLGVDTLNLACLPNREAHWKLLDLGTNGDRLLLDIGEVRVTFKSNGKAVYDITSGGRSIYYDLTADDRGEIFPELVELRSEIKTMELFRAKEKASRKLYEALVTADGAQQQAAQPMGCPPASDPYTIRTGRQVGKSTSNAVKQQ